MQSVANDGKLCANSAGKLPSLTLNCDLILAFVQFEWLLMKWMLQYLYGDLIFMLYLFSFSISTSTTSLLLVLLMGASLTMKHYIIAFGVYYHLGDLVFMWSSLRPLMALMSAFIMYSVNIESAAALLPLLVTNICAS